MRTGKPLFRGQEEKDKRERQKSSSWSSQYPPSFFFFNKIAPGNDQESARSGWLPTNRLSGHILRVEKLHEQEGKHVSFNGKVHLCYRVALNFCGSLILRMGDFCVLWELIFAIAWEKLVFGININFCYFLGSRLLFRVITFSFFEYKQSNTGERHAGGIKR